MWVKNTGKAVIHYAFNSRKKVIPMGPGVEIPDEREANLVLGKYARLGVIEVAPPSRKSFTTFPPVKEEKAAPAPKKSTKKKTAKKKG